MLSSIFIQLLIFLSFVLCGVFILRQNPVTAVLSFIIVFIISAVLLIYVGVEFLAVIYLLVYIGAVAVLFLFIVMLLNVYQSYEDIAISSLSIVIGLSLLY